MGIPQKFAEFGAGVAQLVQDPKTRGGIDTFGDDPFDNYWIKFGYAFQKDYSSKFGSLTPEDLKTGIKRYQDINGKPPRPLGSGYLE
jgi:hypothetical protein